jgi:hypothetical protein
MPAMSAAEAATTATPEYGRWPVASPMITTMVAMAPVRIAPRRTSPPDVGPATRPTAMATKKGGPDAPIRKPDRAAPTVRAAVPASASGSRCG